MQSKEEKMRVQKSPTILICIQGKDEQGVRGMLVSPCKEEPEAFSGLEEMILKLDDLCGQVSGTFSQWKPKSLPSGRKGFLEVQVKARMYGSLQGLARGKVTGDRYVGFRSALELIHMVSRIETDM